MMCDEGYEFKNGKYPSIRGKGQKRFIRFKSLKEGYTVDDIKKRIIGDNSIMLKKQNKEFDLLINIQEKIKQSKSDNYVKWAKKLNLKQAAKVLMFLQE